MKKRITIMLVLLCVASCFCGFAACKKNEPTTLSPPTGLNVNDEEILTWDKVDGASSYLVEIDDKSYETKHGIVLMENNDIRRCPNPRGSLPYPFIHLILVFYLLLYI